MIILDSSSFTLSPEYHVAGLHYCSLVTWTHLSPYIDKQLPIELTPIPPADDSDVLPFDRAAAGAFGALLGKVDQKRRRTLDRMIAAQALDLGLTLVAANTDDFDDIPGLTVEKWA